MRAYPKKVRRINVSDDEDSVQTVRVDRMYSDSDSDSDGYERNLTQQVEVHHSDSDDDSECESVVREVDAVLERSQTAGVDTAAGPRQKSRGWCFTINNYDESDIHRLRDFHDSTNGCKYLIVGKEVGEQGTPHLQGYLFVENPRYGNVIREACGGRGHWSAAKGTPAQNQTYCSKDGDFIELGELPKQGKRNDLATLAKRVCTEGATLQTLVDGGEYDVIATYLRNEKSVTKLAGLVSGKRDASVTPTVHWIYGETGTGKSRWVQENHPDAYRFPCDGTPWWDGYTGQKVVVFDDFRSNSGLSFSMFLKVLDRYPLRVQQKGTSCELLASHFIITSPMHPENCFQGTGENQAQLMRRITKVERMGPPELQPIFNSGM